MFGYDNLGRVIILESVHNVRMEIDVSQVRGFRRGLTMQGAQCVTR